MSKAEGTLRTHLAKSQEMEILGSGREYDLSKLFVADPRLEFFLLTP